MSMDALEREVARLHLSDFIVGLGPAPNGVHVLVLPEKSYAEEWVHEGNQSLTEHRIPIKDFAATLDRNADDPESEKQARKEIMDFARESEAVRFVPVRNDVVNSVSSTTATCIVVVADDADPHALEPNSGIEFADSVTRLKLKPDLMSMAVAVVFGREVSDLEAGLLCAMPRRRRYYAMLSSQSIEEVHDTHTILTVSEAEQLENEKAKKPRSTRQARFANQNSTVSERNVPKHPKLSEMHGYGKAADWGMEVAKDMFDWRSMLIEWSDVDAGILLSGAPGCGKTTFAKALAAEMDAHLVVGSYSVWLGSGLGHQGDMIRLMRAAFAEAIEHAPSVLLIDEIDNFVDRATDKSNNAEWNRGVTNALLECLDGALERDGVIVVGATNNPEVVDAAMKRAGRLDKHIEIPKPDNKARLAILKQHLKVDIDLSGLEIHTAGMSGADLEQVAREARRKARRERVEMTRDHVVAVLPKRVDVSPEAKRLSSVHEAGHAIVASILGFGIGGAAIELTTLAVQTEGRSAAGVTGIDFHRMNRGLEDYRDVICVLVAGAAAETIVFGAYGEGSRSDFEFASDYAKRAVVETALAGYYVVGTQPTREQYDRMNTEIADQLKRAIGLLKAHLEALCEVADILEREGIVKPPAVFEAISRQPEQLPLALVS